ncbi:MAG: UbiA family prenyltransferase [Archangium sp.]
MLERLFRAADRRRWTLALAIATPVWIALVRMLLERYLSLGDVPLRRPAFPWFAHIVVFYLTMSVTLSAVLTVLGKLQWKQAMNQVGMGLTLGCLPPIIDVLALGRGKFAYEYAPTTFPWLLSGPDTVLPPGETTTLWLTIALMTFAVWRATKSAARTVVTTVVTWALVQLFLVGLPAGSQWLSARTAMAPSDWRNALFGVAAMSGVVTMLGQWKRLVTRVPQVSLPMLFVALGAAQRGRFDGPASLAAVMVLLLGIGFTLANDWYDRREDEAAGRTTSLDENAAEWLALVPLVFVAHVLATRLELGLALVGFAVVSFAYHADPLRLKCVFPLSYKTEGFLGGLCFFAGLIAATDQLPSTTSLGVTLLVAVGTPIALVFKDLKDVDADSQAGVKTAFVVGERRGLSRMTLRRMAALGLAISLVLVSVWSGQRALMVFALTAPIALLAVANETRAVISATLLAEVLLALAAAAKLAAPA